MAMGDPPDENKSLKRYCGPLHEHRPQYHYPLSLFAKRSFTHWRDYTRPLANTPDNKASANTRIAEPMIAGRIATPAMSGPKWPNNAVPIQAPITPTMAEARNPPGIRPGTNASAIHAQTAATIRKSKNPSMLIYNLLRLLRWFDANCAAKFHFSRNGSGSGSSFSARNRNRGGCNG